MSTPLRRVITGTDADGRSCILIDGPSSSLIWSSDASPADNGGNADAGAASWTFDIPTGGTRFVVHDFLPGQGTRMHATDTLDYLVILSGEITFITETGETLVRAGDVIVDRGHLHCWRNDGPATCRLVNILSPAQPVGEGARHIGEGG